ncbi:cupin domain-containing protein [Vibrio sp.]|nr:cupin domain-containing protein [Vibrio sp.]
MSLTFTFKQQDFLEHYWQKKPGVFRQALANFDDLITPDELAGFTMEEEIDSRYVSNYQNTWEVEHGPFDEEKLTSLRESHWQLIMQAANHWHPDVATLAQPFEFLPQWLFDDIMVCYSSPKGGVGPHIDQYDVFIIQGHGKRSWKVGAKDNGQYTETTQHSQLRQIEGFEPIIDEILEPGDMIYIPAGFPHEGDTLEHSMSYSVGFRSPKEQELLSNIADYVIAHDKGDHHLEAPNRPAQPTFNMITQSDRALLKEMLLKQLDDSTFDEFLGCMLSQSRHLLDVVEPEEPYHPSDVQSNLYAGDRLIKVLGLKVLFNEGEVNTAYINGEKITVSAELSPLLHALIQHNTLSIHDLDNHQSVECFELITELINKGYWYLSE